MSRVKLFLLLLTTSSTVFSADLSLMLEQDAKSKDLKLLLKNKSSQKQEFFDVFAKAASPPVKCRFARIENGGKITHESEEFSLNTQDSYAFSIPVEESLSWLYPGEKAGMTVSRSKITGRLQAVLATLPNREIFNVVRFSSRIGLDDHFFRTVDARSPYYNLRDYIPAK
jgi:hypothetical protein